MKDKDDNIHKKRSTKIGDKPKNSMTDKLMPQVNYILDAHQFQPSILISRGENHISLHTERQADGRTYRAAAIIINITINNIHEYKYMWIQVNFRNKRIVI